VKYTLLEQNQTLFSVTPKEYEAIIPLGVFNILGVKKTTFSEIIVLFLTISITLIYSNITYNLIEIKLGRFLRNSILKKR
jgi:hypothetical protein